MLQKCEAITDDVAAARKAELPIEHLAKMGHVAEALRYVNRYLRQLPNKKVLATTCMAEVGAKICLDADDLPRMEKYLAAMEATEPFNTRKCDIGFSVNSVRNFRALNGILDPADAIGRGTAGQCSVLACHAAVQAGNGGSQAQKTQGLPSLKWRKRPANPMTSWIDSSIFVAYRLLRGVEGCRRRQTMHTEARPEDRDEVLDASTLMKLGMKSQAISRAKKDIAQKLEKLSEMTDPRYPFPVHSICESLQFLAEHGEKNSAKHWLRRALKEMPTWPVSSEAG